MDGQNEKFDSGEVLKCEGRGCNEYKKSTSCSKILQRREIICIQDIHHGKQETQKVTDNEKYKRKSKKNGASRNVEYYFADIFNMSGDAIKKRREMAQ